MDLYGDLPPAADEGESAIADRVATIPGGWSSASVNCGRSGAAKLRPRQLKALTGPEKCKELTDDVRTRNSDGGAVSSNKNIKNCARASPRALLFKPRQTSSASAPSNSDRATNKSGLVHDQDQGVTEVFSVSTKFLGEKRKTNNECFNANTRFEVDDEPYDPMRPNDYIAYCEERLQIKRQLKLNEENRQLLQQQEQQRQQIEKERTAAAAAGDYARILELSTGTQLEVGSNPRTVSSFVRGDLPVGRGRGGAINLPAWMTEKLNDATNDLREETSNESIERYENGVAGGVQSLQHADRQHLVRKKKLAKTLAFKPSRVVLLKNMVSPSEAEEEQRLRASSESTKEAGLELETKEECSKYGFVTCCKLHLLSPVIQFSDQSISPISISEEERVRIFVQFERQDAAVKAYRELNGRYFAGRRISAEFFDEGKFLRNELDLEPEVVFEDSS